MPSDLVMATLAPLLENTVVVVAHPDDEVIGCGCLLQRMKQARVVFATDGAPLNRQFWPKHDSREQYASIRKLEACDALAYADVNRIEYLTGPESPTIPDQELFRNLEAAAESLRRIVRGASPKALLTLAYEGGHPDHDCCSFLVQQIASESGIAAWEMPLYHLEHRGLARQSFRDTDATELTLDPNSNESKKKQLMMAAYSSQADFLMTFSSSTRESFRPLVADRYNYFHPPHEGRLNYESWGWPITGADVCTAFADYLHARLTADRRSA
jgi:N-acetylglucosamine malate deacetylase 2